MDVPLSRQAHSLSHRRCQPDTHDPLRPPHRARPDLRPLLPLGPRRRGAL